MDRCLVKQKGMALSDIGPYILWGDTSDGLADGGRLGELISNSLPNTNGRYIYSVHVYNL